MGKPSRVNQTAVSDFLLLGLSEKPEEQPLLFGVFLGMYLVTMTGKLFIILAISSDPHLHTPMYFFLANLALTDACCTSASIPKMLANIHTQSRTISYSGCLAQVYFLLMFGGLDNCLLAVVAYDRYVAICQPLHYSMAMSPQFCVLTLVMRWMLTNCPALMHTLQLLTNLENRSSVSEFLLLGLPIQQEQQGVFFALFLGMYLTTVLGNLLITLLIRLDSRLHTPMYFFLSHLTFSDVSLSSVTVPKTLMNMQTQQQSIPYVGCISQVYFFMFFGCLNNLLLTVMAYDRYLAVCRPLHYTTIMKEGLCIILVAGSWFFSCVQTLLHTLLVGQVSFCAGTIIPHFFCDLAVALKSSCSDTSLNELLILTEGGLIFILPLSGILGSYIRMAGIILKVPSFKRISKVLSTCGSHLFVVFLYYGTIAGAYFFPSSGNSKNKNIIASVMYMVVTPRLNRFIYSLRNKDMKHALQKIFRTKDSPLV
ncbi:olfactory receptor 1J4-like [Eumetopias jubatus]|uniref:olfactory receptor 1J4-like n=1 Tax=Eumetopias jubatus TaxID=34886 RepID=UPI00101612E7|nr:olfactory receptor 1J4-like [Eumetopias jubatus]